MQRFLVSIFNIVFAFFVTVLIKQDGIMLQLLLKSANRHTFIMNRHRAIIPKGWHLPLGYHGWDLISSDLKLKLAIFCVPKEHSSPEKKKARHHKLVKNVHFFFFFIYVMNLFLCICWQHLKNDVFVSLFSW